MSKCPFDAGAQLRHALEFKRDNPELVALLVKVNASRARLLESMKTRDAAATSKEFGYLVDVAVTLSRTVFVTLQTFGLLHEAANEANKPVIDRAVDTIIAAMATGRPGDESSVTFDIEG